MDTFTHRDARRDFLKSISVNLAVAVPLATLLGTAHAAKANKKDFFFQEVPKDGKRCASCRLFVLEKEDVKLGTCTVLEGVISADGWCMAYTPK